MIKATPDPYKGIVIKYPKCYKICNGSPEFKKIMVQALKQQVMDRTHKPKGTEAQREATWGNWLTIGDSLITITNIMTE